MPRPMPPLDRRFHRQSLDALELASAGEDIRLLPNAHRAIFQIFHISRVELLYELAFLRIYASWEAFLEESFFRYLCGFSSRFGQSSMVRGRYFPNLSDAQRSVLSGHRYLLWHSVDQVARRCSRHMRACRHEIVLSSNRARLENLGAIRHRIVHNHADARARFDSATMTFAGRRYRGARPGRFLRDINPAIVRGGRWLESLANELN